MTDFATRLRELREKATPVEKAELARYEHGGGRLMVVAPGEQRTLIADFYHEADRELFYLLRTHAEQIAALVEAATLVSESEWQRIRYLSKDWVSVDTPHFKTFVAALDALNGGRDD